MRHRPIAARNAEAFQRSEGTLDPPAGDERISISWLIQTSQSFADDSLQSRLPSRYCCVW